MNLSADLRYSWYAEGDLRHGSEGTYSENMGPGIPGAVRHER